MLYRLLTLLDWALIAASLFNAVAQLWLGLTIILNAERRSWGTWLGGGGMILGALFFVGHTAVVGRVIGTFSDEMIGYWRLGWVVLVAAPYLWYLVMAWYAGVLRRRDQRVRLAIVSLIGLCALLLALRVDPLPSYGELLPPPSSSLAVIGAPALARLVYPGFAALCILFALAALRTPAASDRFMGEQARLRARPWLVAASLVLLLIALAIGAGAAWFLDVVVRGFAPDFTARAVTFLIIFDLLISLLIAAAVVLIGRAVVAYEIFTGKALPRGALARQWRRALILAAGYGITVGWSLSGAGIPDQPIYQLLIATVVMTVFFALLGWRSTADREQTIVQLRPFVASQQLYAGLLRPDSVPDRVPDASFRAICADLLGVEAAYLVPLGSLAPLVGAPLAYPPGATPPDAADLAAELPVNAPLCLPIEAARYAGAEWAVPLLGERGLIGLLLLGPRRDGRVYTQEEIEVARAAGERLIDAQAGAELARRLVALQRRRLAESQILDRRTRRVLHDEVLPQIHATLLQIGPDSESSPGLQSAIANLQGAHRQISDLLHELPTAIGADLAGQGPLVALRRAVEADMGGAFDRIEWAFAPEAERAARRLDPIGAEVLYYAAREAARNAARHGRGADPQRPLHLRVSAACQPGDPPHIILQVSDDGVGISPSQAPAELGGHGLALHSTLLAIIGGSLSVAGQPGRSTQVTLTMPVPEVATP